MYKGDEVAKIAKTVPQQPRPLFDNAWGAFIQIAVPVKDVGRIIGGHVEVNINIPPEQGGFANACPIRMSYVLNYSGFPIHQDPRYSMVSGGDKKWYLYRVAEMMSYLENTFGPPDKTITGAPAESDFADKQGIVVVRGHGWSDAIGHITLWNGKICSDNCHLTANPDNGTFIPETASIWVLK